MDKRARNFKFEKIQKLAFQIECEMSDILQDPETDMDTKNKMQQLMLEHTKCIIDDIGDLYIDDVKKREVEYSNPYIN